jgi:hypothetical protein
MSRSNAWKKVTFGFFLLVIFHILIVTITYAIQQLTWTLFSQSLSQSITIIALGYTLFLYSSWFVGVTHTSLM